MRSPLHTCTELCPACWRSPSKHARDGAHSSQCMENMTKQLPARPFCLGNPRQTPWGVAIPILPSSHVETVTLLAQLHLKDFYISSFLFVWHTEGLKQARECCLVCFKMLQNLIFLAWHMTHPAGRDTVLLSLFLPWHLHHRLSRTTSNTTSSSQHCPSSPHWKYPSHPVDLCWLNGKKLHCLSPPAGSSGAMGALDQTKAIVCPEIIYIEFSKWIPAAKCIKYHWGNIKQLQKELAFYLISLCLRQVNY